MSDEFDGYVTRHALTAGIVKRRLRWCGIGDMVEVVGQRYGAYYHGEGKDWHRTYESARKRAEKMRDAKVVSLRKSMEKMQALTFPEPTP